MKKILTEWRKYIKENIGKIKDTHPELDGSPRNGMVWTGWRDAGMEASEELIKQHRSESAIFDAAAKIIDKEIPSVPYFPWQFGTKLVGELQRYGAPEEEIKALKSNLQKRDLEYAQPDW